MESRKAGILVFCLAVALSFPVWGEDELNYPPARVLLDGQLIVEIHVGTKAFSPQYRADSISDRLLKFAKDLPRRPESIEVQDLEIVSEISADDFFLMAVFDKDASVEGRDRKELALEISEKMRNAIRDYREKRSLRIIAQGVFFTLLSTVILLILLKLQERGVQKLEAFIRAATFIPSVHIGNFEFFTADRIKHLAVLVGKIFKIMSIFVLVYFYVQLGLSFFPWTQRLAMHLLDYGLAALSTMGNALWNQMPGLVFIGVLVAISHYVLKSLKYFFGLVRDGKVIIREFDSDLADPTYKVLRLLVIAFAVVVAYPYIPGSDSPAFKGVSIFMGVLFSLGSTSAIGNVAAGLSLTYMQAFREGDVVKIGDVTGTVVQRKTMVTRVRTFKNETITLANSAVMNAHITNYSIQAQRSGLVLHTTITIGYDVPWQQVHGLLIEAARATSNVLESPAPFVLQTALNDFYVAYQINLFTKVPEKMPRITSDLHANIQDKFNEAGVEIMSPHYAQIRDGNRITIPESYLPPDYAPGSIKISGWERASEVPSRKTPAEAVKALPGDSDDAGREEAK
jgi:small-conductance mechanosensitive channel